MKKLLLFPLAVLMLGLDTHVDAAGMTIADQPKKEDVRGLPNVSTQTSGNWDLFADAFAWYASEQASAVWADIIEIGNKR